ncbi:MAG: PAS-domain containing protein [Pseudomonadota bacterium]
MLALDIPDLIGLTLAAFCVATAALITASFVCQRHYGPVLRHFDILGPEPASFVFDGDILVDASDRGEALLRSLPGAGTPWEQLLDHLAHRSPSAASSLRSLRRGQNVSIPLGETSDIPQLRADWRNGFLRVAVIDEADRGAIIPMNSHSIAALEDQVAFHKTLAKHAPFLIWKSTGDGRTVWCNPSYAQLHDDVAETGESWDAPSLFGLTEVPSEAGAAHSAVRRVSVKKPGTDDVLWFDTLSFPLGDGILHFALPADDAVKAEGALREFIQTLAKTFAHLPIGLAIFSKTRKLVLFNPAMTDLSGLPVTFLSAQPRLVEFLDALREKRVMPEPKNYATWRQEVSALEAEAVNGTFQETWSLPEGQTYRVTGRPHPDGAVAFLFEDITSEIALTRRFRAELELGQAVMDAQSEAIAVFSQSGILTLSNTAYADLWGMDPTTTLGDVRVTDAMEAWLELGEPSPVWGEIRDFVDSIDDRTDWTAQARLKSGVDLSCRIVPLAGGSVLCGFRRQPARSDQQRRLHFEKQS